MQGALPRDPPRGPLPLLPTRHHHPGHLKGKMAKIKKLQDVETLPVRKKGRPRKVRPDDLPDFDYRLKIITDPRLIEMKTKMNELPLGSTQWESARREYFAALLDSKLDVETRADLLVALAKKDDAKSAPVALRALQDINEATRLKDAGASNAPSIFVLPVGTAVAVQPTEVIEGEVMRRLESGNGEDEEV